MTTLLHTDNLDRTVAHVADRAGDWARLPIEERVQLLRLVLLHVAQQAEAWAAAGVAMKGLDPEAPWSAARSGSAAPTRRRRGSEPGHSMDPGMMPVRWLRAVLS